MNEKYEITDIGEIIENERLPFNINDKNNKVEIAVKVNNWIKARGLSDSRKDIKEIKNIFNVDDKNELIIKAYCLNLTDHFWIQKDKNNIKWENVNYFDNDFDKVLQKGNFDHSIDKNVKNPTPNFCVDGSIQKRWVIIDGERVLLKGSMYQIMQEPFNEKIVSLILDEFGIEHVHYDQKRNSDEIPYSECKTMSDRDIEFINAYWVIESENYEKKDTYTHYIDICNKNNLCKAKEKVDEMIAIDFLIGNNDRHKGNFGIMRDANTLNWISMAKIFDNGNCLFFDRKNDEIESFGIDSLGKSFEASNRLQLNEINYPEWYSTDKGRKMVNIIADELRCNERLLLKRIDKIVEITKKRKDIFENIIKSNIKK